MNTVLVVAPHPDDESLGVGGTLLKHIANGDHVYWLIFTTTEGSDIFPETFTQQRKQEIAAVATDYGFTEYFQLPFQTTKLETYPLGEMVSATSEILHRVKPNTIYVPYAHDIHSDHQIVFNVLSTATKSFRYPFVREVLAYETLSETNFSPTTQPAFNPNVFINITPHFEKKMAVLKHYDSEIKPHPFPRSKRAIESLAVLRGSACNTEYAEAFMLLKELR